MPADRASITLNPRTAMKTSTTLRIPLIAAILGTFSLLGSLAMAAEADDSLRKNVVEKVKRLEDRMSDMFRDTWKELRDSVEARTHPKHSLSSASVDVRERNDGYTVRVSLPGRDIGKVEVGMINGNRLRIFAPANGKSGPYEQILVLEGVAVGTQPEVTKKPKDELVVIHLSKLPVAEESVPEAGETPPKPLSAPSDRWDRDILERMERMRHEMDELFQQSVKDFGAVPGLGQMFDHSRFGSSVDLREEEGSYVVRAYLPDREAANVKVTVDDGNVLTIEAEAEESIGQEEGAAVLKRESHYLQHLTLPGPVAADQLKVDRKDGMLVITIPKKTEG